MAGKQSLTSRKKFKRAPKLSQPINAMMRTAPADVFKLPTLNQKLVPLNQHMNDYYIAEDTGKTREYSQFWLSLIHI